MRLHEIMKRRLILSGSSIAAFLVCLLLVPHLIEYLQLRHEASKANNALLSHGINGCRVSVCQRKFRGIVVEGHVTSVSDGETVEAVLTTAGIDADVWITLRSNEGPFHGEIWRSGHKVHLRSRFQHGAPLGSGEASGSTGPGGSGEESR